MLMWKAFQKQEFNIEWSNSLFRCKLKMVECPHTLFTPFPIHHLSFFNIRLFFSGFRVLPNCINIRFLPATLFLTFFSLFQKKISSTFCSKGRGCRFFKIFGLNANEGKVIGLAPTKKRRKEKRKKRINYRKKLIVQWHVVGRKNGWEEVKCNILLIWQKCRNVHVNEDRSSRNQLKSFFTVTLFCGESVENQKTVKNLT